MGNHWKISGCACILLGLAVSSAQAGYVDEVIDLAPISYWRLGETTPATSAVAADEYVVTPNPGTYNGALTNIAGPLVGDADTAVVFDSDSDYVSIDGSATVGSAFDFDRTDSWTILVWIKTTQTSVTQVANKLSGGQGYSVGLNSSGQVQVQVTGTGIALERTNDSVNDGQWHFIAWTYNGNSDVSGSLIYIDGVLEATTTITNTLTGASVINNTVPFTIGQRAGGTTQPVVGAVDEVAVLDQVLGADDIADLYVAATTVPEPASGLLFLLGVAGMVTARKPLHG